MELKAEVKAGKISKKEFREKIKAEIKAIRKEVKAKRIAFLKEFKAERKNLIEEFRKKIAEKRALLKEARSDFRIKFGEENAKMRADLKAKIEADKKARMEVKAKLEAGEISLDEAKTKLKTLREERNKIRESFVKEMKDKKVEIKDELELGGLKSDLKEELKAKKERRKKIKEIKKEFKGIEKIMPMPPVKFDGEAKVKSKVEGDEAEKTEFDTKASHKSLHEAKMNLAYNLKGIVEKKDSDEKNSKDVKAKSSSTSKTSYGRSVYVDPSLVGNGRMCTDQYAPVCALVHGKKVTFSNKCRAGDNKILYMGECDKPQKTVSGSVKAHGSVKSGSNSAKTDMFGGFGMSN